MSRFVRFIVITDHDDRTRCTGVVASLRILGEEGKLPDYHVAYSREIFDKLNADMPCPPFETKNIDSDGVCWFKSTATKWIAAFRDIVAILEDSDIQTRMLHTDTPGMIIYEDEIQVVAKSHRY